MSSFSNARYDSMQYRLCGQTGLKLSVISLGLWQNFGDDRPYPTQLDIVNRAFDLGITHFDLANNYGPPVGQAELTFKKILSDGLGTHRDELVISTKAGYRVWPGPYGDGGSKKYLLAACDQSLKRTGLDYFDIFYHHRQDTEVPIAETMGALNMLVQQGKALYIGVSSHSGARLNEATSIIQLKNQTPLTSVMSRYNLLQRQDEIDKWPIASSNGIGGIAFCPLAQGLLTGKYLQPEPAVGGRMRHQVENASPNALILEQIRRARALNQLALSRGQSLAQMAIAWVLRHPAICSAIIGVSSVKQLEENVAALAQLTFQLSELSKIDEISPVGLN